MCEDWERKRLGKKLKLIIVWSEEIICDSGVLLNINIVNKLRPNWVRLGNDTARILPGDAGSLAVALN